MNLLKWQQDLETIMLKKPISPLSMQVKQKEDGKNKQTNKQPHTNIFPQHRTIPANKSTHLCNFIELFQWNVLLLLCLEIKPCPRRYSSQHKPRHQSLGQGQAADKEGNQHSWDSKAQFLSLPLIAALSPACSHTPYPRLVPSEFPPAAQCSYIRKHRVGAWQDWEGRPFPGSP